MTDSTGSDHYVMRISRMTVDKLGELTMLVELQAELLEKRG